MLTQPRRKVVSLLDSTATQSSHEKSMHFEKVIDNSLDSIAIAVSNMKNMALDINCELDAQSEIIDQVDQRTEIQDGKINKINVKVKRLLN
jgi:hypothetical protein